MKLSIGTLLIGSALLVGGMAMAQSAAQNSERILTYLFETFRAEDKMTKGLIDLAENELAGEEAVVKDIARGAAAAFDIRTLSARYSGPLSQTLSPGEVAHCLKFIDSDEGVALLEAGRKSASLRELPQQLSLLSSDTQRAVDSFFELSCVQKVIAFMRSEEANQINHQYGGELVCIHAKRTSAEVLQTLKDRGACQAFAEAR